MEGNNARYVLHGLGDTRWIKPCHLLDVIKNKLSFTIPNKMCKKYQIFKNAHFHNKCHICRFKHSLQNVYAHHFHKVWSWSCWHSRCTLHRSVNWWVAEVPVLLKWRGPLRGGRGRWNQTRESNPGFRKPLGTESRKTNACFSTKSTTCVTWIADQAFDTKSEPGLKNNDLKLVKELLRV